MYFGHLSAIINRSKHGGMKRLILSFAQLSLPDKSYSIKVPSYNCNNKSYPGIELKAFLTKEFDRASMLHVEMDNDSNEVVTKR